MRDDSQALLLVSDPSIFTQFHPTGIGRFGRPLGCLGRSPKNPPNPQAAPNFYFSAIFLDLGRTSSGRPHQWRRRHADCIDCSQGRVGQGFPGLQVDVKKRPRAAPRAAIPSRGRASVRCCVLVFGGTRVACGWRNISQAANRSLKQTAAMWPPRVTVKRGWNS
jgi:hypothetical protein